MNKNILKNRNTLSVANLIPIVVVMLLYSCGLNTEKQMFSNSNKQLGENDKEGSMQFQNNLNEKDEDIKKMDPPKPINQNKQVFKVKVKINKKIYEIEVIKDMKLIDLVNKIQKNHSKDVEALFYASSDEYGLLDNNFTLENYGIISSGNHKLEGIKINEEKRATHIVYEKDPHIDIANYQGKRIPVKSYHVSCKSYKPKEWLGKENLGGIVLYSYGDKLTWEVNKVRCKTGYIIVKKIDDIKHLESKYGIVHGNVYKSVFKKELDKNVIGSGFAFKDGRWKFNSFTFNAKRDTFHSKEKGMNELEEKYVSQALQNWILHGKQNLNLDKDLVILELT